MQRFIQLTEGYIYPAKTGGWIKTVALVENQEAPHTEAVPGQHPDTGDEWHHAPAKAHRSRHKGAAETTSLTSTTCFCHAQHPYCMRPCSLRLPVSLIALLLAWS